MGHPEDYGLEESEYKVPEMTVKAYYNYFWWTERGSTQRSKVVMPVLQGPLVGKAVMIMANAEGSCMPEMFPEAFPSAGSGEMFLYSASAVGVFRETVLTNFFHWYRQWVGHEPSFTKSSFTESLAALQSRFPMSVLPRSLVLVQSRSPMTVQLKALGVMLGATLADLAPVNTIPIYQAVVMSE
eukprot:gene17702-24061_t